LHHFIEALALLSLLVVAAATVTVMRPRHEPPAPPVKRVRSPELDAIERAVRRGRRSTSSGSGRGRAR